VFGNFGFASRTTVALALAITNLGSVYAETRKLTEFRATTRAWITPFRHLRFAHPTVVLVIAVVARYRHPRRPGRRDKTQKKKKAAGDCPVPKRR
jgi:hypothetical protein